jgi:hypothetical protein
MIESREASSWQLLVFAEEIGRVKGRLRGGLKERNG